jgi:hypothetical protein
MSYSHVCGDGWCTLNLSSENDILFSIFMVLLALYIDPPKGWLKMVKGRNRAIVRFDKK